MFSQLEPVISSFLKASDWPKWLLIWAYIAMSYFGVLLTALDNNPSSFV